ncbi:MAG: extracellular solute-binding protein, partial [Lachnospiraceae bacterium]|nr:extracellular solute-binding protein [Lachnospiraceae bacterium]
YYMPECGTNLWFDSMVIPANAENPELANKFINYMLTHEAAAANTLGVGYTSPVQSVFEEMTAAGGEYEGNEAYIPRVGYALDESFNDNEYLRTRLSELWIKVKANSAN